MWDSDSENAKTNGFNKNEFDSAEEKFNVKKKFQPRDLSLVIFNFFECEIGFWICFSLNQKLGKLFLFKPNKIQKTIKKQKKNRTSKKMTISTHIPRTDSHWWKVTNNDLKCVCWNCVVCVVCVPPEISPTKIKPYQR